MSRRLRLVSDQLPAPPYPADTRAKGFKYEFDLERIAGSRTWAMTPPEIRPWLLMLWMTSWTSIPCGSYDDDDEVIAGRIGMPINLFRAHRDVLMRHWEPHADGLLYHPVMTEMVMRMLEWRRKDSDRVRQWRQRQTEKKQDPADDVTRNQHVNNPLVTVPSPPPSPTPESSKDKQPSAACSRPGNDPAGNHELKLTGEPEKGQGARLPACPFEKLVDLYHRVLPEAARIVNRDSQQRRAKARERWKDLARLRGYTTVAEGLEHWEKLFAWCRESKFLMGMIKPKPGHRQFELTLDFLISEGRFTDVIEGKYHRDD
jgi:hypothetical protein